MMKYVCLGYHDEQAWAAMSPGERDALIEETVAYQDTLRESGNYLAGQALQGARSAATLRSDRGTISVTDGPFAETKEQLGGFMLLEASDLNHAIQLMSKTPCMRLGGSLEIRPLNEDLNAEIDARSAVASN
jgi:hypothetical protein